MFGVQQSHCLLLPYPSLAAQQVVSGLSVSVINPIQHVLQLGQLLLVVWDQIHVAAQPVSAHSNFWNRWQVQGLSCCIWDVHTFGVVLAAQKVEVQSGSA